MALSPADFAAYSRATGTPYPETPEERAQMVPEVRAFRQKQLQQSNNQGSNAIALGIGLGLGLAGLGAGAMKLRGRGKKQPKKDTAGKSSVKMVDLEAPAGSYGPNVEFKEYPGGPLALRTQPVQESSSQVDSRKLAQNQFASSLEAPPESYGPTVETKDYPGGPLVLREQPIQTVTSDFDSRKAAQNQLASFLEAPTESYGPNVEFKDYPLTRKEVYQKVATKPESDLPQVSRPQGEVEESMLITDPNTGEVYRRGGDASIRAQQAQQTLDDRVNQLLSEVSVGESGQMLAGPEVAREAAQMMGTEASRQAATVKRIINEEGERVLDEMRSKPVTLTETYEAFSEPAAQAQNINAINTAEDQSDGRFLRELQRNEDIDMAVVNEAILDKPITQVEQDALFRENQLVQDARDYLIRQEIDLKYDYRPEESRQAAAVGQALERIQNNPKRLAAEGIIDELLTEARAVADRAKFAKEQRQGKTGELPGYRDVDNIRQRKEQKTLSALDTPRETIEAVLTGEDAPIETNLQGRQLRGGKVDEAGDIRFYGAGAETTDASTGARVGKQGEKYKEKAQLEAKFNRYSDDELEQIASNKSRIAYGDMMQQDLDELQTAQRILQTRARTSIDKGIDMSGPQQRALSRGRKGIDVSESSRKRFENQRPVLASQPVQDVARSMETLRQGMSVEPSELAPVAPDIRNIGIGFEGNKEIVGAIGPSDAYTGAARDAAGSVKNVVVGESAPLVQGDVVSNPEVAAQIEDQSQAFLQRAISGGLTQKANPGVEVYETPRFIGPAEAGPGRVPLSRTAAADPQSGPDPSQRLGYTRYYVGTEKTGSKPAGIVTGVSPTMNIDYASMPKSDVYRPTDVGRVVYQGPVQTSAERLAQSTGGLARPMSILPDRGDTRLTSSLPVPQYDPRYKTLNRSQYNPPAPGYTDIGDRPAPTEAAPIGPLTQSPGLSKIGRQVREGSGYYPGPGQTESTYLTQYGPNIKYPRMRGEERFLTEQLINDPRLRGGPVKMPSRFLDQFVIERPRGY